MMRWILAVLFILYAISASAATQWVESLGVGGGFGDTGLTITDDGNVYTDGNLLESGAYTGISTKYLAGLWRLDSAATSAKDWSGTGNALAQAGTGTTAVAGKYGLCLTYDGDGYTGGAITGFATTGDASISGWIKHDTASAEQWAFGFNGTGSGAYLGFAVKTDGTIDARMDGTGDVTVNSGVQIDDNEWHFVVAARDYGAYLYLYVDGLLVGSVAEAVGELTGDQEYYIGSIGSGGGDWVGSVDEVAAWSVMLTADEVRALYGQRAELIDTQGAVYIGGNATVAGDVVTSGGAVLPAVVTFTADDTTPTVTAGNMFIVPATWTAGNNITAFDDGVNGQTITVIGGDADCAVADGATVELAGGANWTATPEDTLTLIRSGSVWYEISRSDNSE